MNRSKFYLLAKQVDKKVVPSQSKKSNVKGKYIAPNKRKQIKQQEQRKFEFNQDEFPPLGS